MNEKGIFEKTLVDRFEKVTDFEELFKTFVVFIDATLEMTEENSFDLMAWFAAQSAIADIRNIASETFKRLKEENAHISSKKYTELEDKATT